MEDKSIVDYAVKTRSLFRKEFKKQGRQYYFAECHSETTFLQWGVLFWEKKSASVLIQNEGQSYFSSFKHNFNTGQIDLHSKNATKNTSFHLPFSEYRMINFDVNEIFQTKSCLQSGISEQKAWCCCRTLQYTECLAVKIQITDFWSI